ncbi:DUF6705 family protein [Riemerella columbipharyngis]|uniref:DUF6705 domain-containing protein n=1 Tax=Riemerella columbipharyngis TaxID=1071918 RepID=A0A1G6YE94_9FLAO|nr:DUF6705 family protein [Riemerella columbipharyngis]SDD87915.1 hypothetical protein SAMN05421544_101106 [Riemerella columbipharyngis]
MKKITLSYLLTLFIANMGTAQEKIGTLRQFEECVSRSNYQSEGCPDLENITYIKDVENRLDKFVGTWTGTYNGKTYTFKFNKRVKYSDGMGNRTIDLLFGRIKVEGANGEILYNTLSESNDSNTYFSGDNFQRNSYIMDFIVNTYCNDTGVVFLRIYDDQPNKMKVLFDRDRTWYDPKKCPNYETYETTLPQKSFVLTKQ